MGRIRFSFKEDNAGGRKLQVGQLQKLGPQYRAKYRAEEIP